MARAMAAAADDSTKAAARAAYNHDIYAASNHSVRDAHLKGWLTLHRSWYGELVPMLPLTVEKIHNVAALFKQGKYSSFSNYISRAKDAHVSAEMSWSDALAQAHTQAVASVTRGIGPAKQATPFDIVRGAAAANVIENGPDYPRSFPVGLAELLTAAPFWALREIEASNAFWRDITFGTGTVCWRLPASKTDPKALGCERSWGCVSSSTDRCEGPCPYHSMARQRDKIDGLRSHLNLSNNLADLPVFPTAAGAVCAKSSVVEALEAAMEEAGETIVGPQGRKYTGHSFRVTGAQLLASMGFDIAIIMLMFRWQSGVVLRYIAEAPLATITDRFRKLKEPDKQGGDRDATAADEQALPLVPKDTPHLDVISAHWQTMLDQASELERRVSEMELSSAPQNFVLNKDSQVWHKILIGDFNHPTSCWKTCCGGHFGRTRSGSAAPRSRTLPSSSCGAQVCERCVPNHC